MNPTDREAYQQRYRARLACYGHDARSLGWVAGTQEARFAALTQLLPVDRLESVLDVGCGFGDLYPFLRAQGFAGSYTGVDFVAELVDVARAAYPEAHFAVADFGTYSPVGEFDLVVASGIFNARLEHEDQWGHVSATLARMYRLARVAVAADFLTAYADAPRLDLYHASPEGVFTLARSLTRRVALLNHYLPFEFAVYLFKDDRLTDRVRFHPVLQGCSE